MTPQTKTYRALALALALGSGTDSEGVAHHPSRRASAP